jgi:uncharacterized protein (DUF4415 family)
MRTGKTSGTTKSGSSSRLGAPSRTNAAVTGKKSKSNGSLHKRASATDWNRLRRHSAADIRRGTLADPDAQPTDAAFWRNAKVVLPTPKQIVTMRLDADLLRWFRQHPGYQTRINAILRAYMRANDESA